ncbi:MAG TPA: T9SS type A sorting domain-containing protein [Flavobacteriales bacterium]|nr:T9SS type A sorting domain-containing protein [Flavobacteriales bacterium]
MRFPLLIAGLSMALLVTAQWPTSPDAPLVICNDASDQKDLRVIPDGMGGWYVLWRDNRLVSNRYAVFGQRLDAQGNLLWEPNGRLLEEVPGRSINMIGATRMNDDKLFICYISGADANGADTVRAMAYDEDGSHAWSQPTLLAHPGPLPGGGISGGNYFPRVVPVLNGVFVGWGTNPMGAADYVHIARVLDDGTNMMPVQGVEVASLNNSIVAGPWTMRHDLADGLLFERRWGNGAGAPLYAMHVNSFGAEQWPALLLVSANSAGLFYEWSSALAATGRMNSVWANSYDLRMAIYNVQGTLLNTAAPIPVCLQAEVQENPFVVQSATETTVFWADNRASAGNGRQVFMQRFDADGEPLLTADGVLAMQCDGNLNGFPRAIAAAEGDHIVVLFTAVDQQGGTAGFRAGRVTDSGFNLWSDTTRFCIPELGPNGGTDFAMTSDGDDGVVAVWFNWQNNAIYAARLDRWGRMGSFTDIAESDVTTLRSSPNPASDEIMVSRTDGRSLGDLLVHSNDGRVVLAKGTNGAVRSMIDIGHLPAGIYSVSEWRNGSRSTFRFIKQ